MARFAVKNEQQDKTGFDLKIVTLLMGCTLHSNISRFLGMTSQFKAVKFSIIIVGLSFGLHRFYYEL